MATYTEADAVERVWLLLRDYGETVTEQLLTDTEVKKIGIRGAEAFYSRQRPRVIVADLVADGTRFLALPVGFAEGVSVVRSIESPVDLIPAQMYDDRDWYIEQTGSGYRIVFTGGFAPSNATTVRVVYTAGRVLAPAAGNTTILDSDFVAFCDLAASICADAIAAKFARTSEPAFNADVVNYRSRVQEWRDIAKRLWERWEQAMGIAGSAGAAGGTGPASAWANWDLPASYGGSQFNHPRYGR